MRKKYNISTIVKFILFSSFGIFAFFINFTLPKYSLNIFGYLINIPSRTTFLVEHITKFLQTSLSPIMPYLALALAFWGVLDLIIHKQKHFKTKIQTILSSTRIIGFIMILMTVFHFGSSAVYSADVGGYAFNKIVVAYCISIPMAAVFLPFLLDYGLVDFIGVLARPVMRPLLKLPGRAAVISVSAFLGNFSVGHIAINDEYKSGKMTLKESLIVGLGLSTVSIAFLMILANMAGIMEYWTYYFFTTFFITIAVTIITVRMPPLKTASNEYKPNVDPKPEAEYSDHLFKNAVNTALDVCEKTRPYHKRFKDMLKSSGSIIIAASNATVFFAVTGILLNKYTPIFMWLGYLFYPLMWLVRIPLNEIVGASSAAVLSFIEVTLPTSILTIGQWSMRVRYMLAVIPVTSIIFLGSFIPCIMGTEVPVKFSDCFFVWLERVIFSILLAGIFGLLMF